MTDTLLDIIAYLFISGTLATPFIAVYLVKRYTVLKGFGKLLANLTITFVLIFVLLFIGVWILFRDGFLPTAF